MHAGIVGNVTNLRHPARFRESVSAILHGKEFAEKDSSFPSHFAGYHLEPALDPFAHSLRIGICAALARSAQRHLARHSGFFQVHAEESSRPSANQIVRVLPTPILRIEWPPQ